SIRKQDGVAEVLRPQSQAVRESRQRTSDLRRGYKEVAEVQQQLKSCVGCCVVCRFVGEEQCYHQKDQCRRRDSEEWVAMEDRIRRVGKELFGGRRMEKFLSCFSCGVPQALCNQWKEEQGDGGRFQRVLGGCWQYQGLLILIW
ncbi:hypothetical protein QBC37DRAFT_249467, partial [Rhypophila decipiens]